MNLNSGFGRKLRHGSASLGITALCLAAALLLNVLVSVLLTKNHVFIDLTSEPIYTMSEECETLLASTLESADAASEGDEPVEVDLIFCAEPDMLIGNTYMRYVYYTALAMQDRFPDHIKVSTVDVWDNPSAVDAYRSNSFSSIYQSDVIVASGTEFRVYPYRSFYTYSDPATDQTPWGYSGEKNFLRGIIAVTRAEAPICALTINHGEAFATEEGRAEYSEFLKIVENAGYEIIYLDLEQDEIPENCRLIVTFDPQTDFVSDFFGGSVSETTKLDAYLRQAHAYMVFADADTPKLPIFEEYLEEWGISFARYTSLDESGVSTDAMLQIVDPDRSINDGLSVIGQYETAALGGNLTKDMRNTGGSPMVIFGNSLSIKNSPTYERRPIIPTEENGLTESFITYTYFKNGHTRDSFNVFTASDTSYAYAKVNGNRLTDANGKDMIADTYDLQNPYRLMTITRESRTVGEGQGYTTINDASYVCAIGSLEFASNAMLQSQSYGNADALQQTLRTIGGEVEPVGIKWAYIHDPVINTDYYTQTQATAWTVVLTLLPAVGMLLTGVIVLVRRRARH